MHAGETSDGQSLRRRAKLTRGRNREADPLTWVTVVDMISNIVFVSLL